MTETRFFILSLFALVFLVAVAVLGEFLEAFTLLSNLLLAVSGILGGFLASSYLHKKSEEQNLGRSASMAFRLSVDIYDTLKDILQKVNDLRSTLPEEGSLESEKVGLMFDVISGKIEVLQRFSLSANTQWKEYLPPEELLELGKRVRTIHLSEDWEVKISEDTHAIKN